jgi:molecular chaperone DnaK (HSP70)
MFRLAAEGHQDRLPDKLLSVVSMPTLSKSFCIEVAGGSAQTIFEQGSEIPAHRREFFSTGDDGQHVIELHVLRGRAQEAANNASYAKYLIHQVPEGPKGTARIEVHFDVDLHENLELRAFDQSTGKELPVRLR